MAVWKILLIGLLACASLGLAMSTVAVPLAQEGGQRWAWLAGLFAATAAVGTLLAFFLRYAGTSLDVKPRWAQRRAART